MDAFITRRGGGGGPAGLNFSVVGGLTQPGSLKENTIWLRTPHSIKRWDVSAKHPYLVSKTKNFNCWPFYDVSGTVSGIAYTDNGDGTVSASGAAVSDATFRISFIDAERHATYLPAGDYFLSGCPTGGSAYSYRVEVKRAVSGETLATDYGDGAAFTLENPAVVRCNIVVAAGATVSNLTFKPQMEKGSAATAFVAGDATGQAWIIEGVESAAEFNALKSNAIQVYPTGARIRVGGDWESVDGMIYQAGELVQFAAEWSGELFDGGDQFTAITGGWTNTSGTTLTTSVYSQNSFSAPASTKNAIDLTDFDTLYVTYTGVTRSAWFGVSKTADLKKYADYAASKQATAAGTLALDVSSLSGEYYVHLVAGAASNTTCAFTATKVWME